MSKKSLKKYTIGFKGKIFPVNPKIGVAFGNEESCICLFGGAGGGMTDDGGRRADDGGGKRISNPDGYLRDRQDKSFDKFRMTKWIPACAGMTKPAINCGGKQSPNKFFGFAQNRFGGLNKLYIDVLYANIENTIVLNLKFEEKGYAKGKKCVFICCGGAGSDIGFKQYCG